MNENEISRLLKTVSEIQSALDLFNLHLREGIDNDDVGRLYGNGDVKISINNDDENHVRLVWIDGNGGRGICEANPCQSNVLREGG